MEKILQQNSLIQNVNEDPQTQKLINYSIFYNFALTAV